MSEKELTKGAKRILEDTEESGTRRWGDIIIFHHAEWVSTLLVVDSWDLSRAYSMSFPHGLFQLVGLKAATNSTSFSSRHGGWTSQDSKMGILRDAKNWERHLEEFGFE